MYISEEEYKKMMEMAKSYDKVKTAQQKYRRANREKYNQWIRDWRLKNPERFSEIQKKYKAKKKGEKQ